MVGFTCMLAVLFLFMLIMYTYHSENFCTENGLLRSLESVDALLTDFFWSGGN
jgi:hypothetical protein